MKKVLFIVAALLLVFALCSCKDEPTKIPDDTSEIAEETSDVVIEDDIYAIAQDDIKNTKIDMTIVAGEIVYQK